MISLMIFIGASICLLSHTSKGQDHNSCGMRSVNIRGRIIGGLQSRPGMWPWQVAIYRTSYEGQRPQFHCGGALINSRWVVSAAHCFKAPSERLINYRYTITAGDFKIFTSDPGEQKRSVLRINIHPNFKANTYENDIALVALDKGVKMGPSVRAICLPKDKEALSVTGKKVSVAGWGLTTKGMPSPTLLHSEFKIQSNKKCNNATEYRFNETVMFCAGDGKGGNDTCKGDSGGSTVREVIRDGRHRWVTVGLVSWGERCGIKGKYGYYTRMEPFVPWIQRKINASIADCGRLPEPQYGEKIEETSTNFGGKVVFQCNKVGFELKGSAQRVCQENGKWNGTRTTCERVECRDPGTLNKGVRRPEKNKYVFEDRIDFQCNKNHTLRGDPFIMCEKTKDWTGSVPRCLAPCRDPGIPIGGRRFQHSFLHNRLVRFRCNPGWTMEGHHTIWCYNGRWNRQKPTCNKMCSRPNRYPANGGIYGSSSYHRHGGSIRFYCHGGYNLVGQGYARCRNGTWNNRQSTCKPVECGNPGKLVNGGKYPNKNKYIFEEKIYFQCKTKYTLRGDRSITCQNDKTWSGSVPRCFAPCRDPGTPTGGRRLQHSFLHDKAVQFRCNRGWRMEGSSTIRCYDGRWDNKTPTCISRNWVWTRTRTRSRSWYQTRTRTRGGTWHRTRSRTRNF